GSAITLHVGKRKMLLRSEELQKFRADRGRRGTLLPRGLQKIDRVELDAPARPASPDSDA
ncbi:MAG TPA: hypothetical protein DCM39_18535, partial [Pantoea sp.]|nr:hypothetical protein [Pantoea sp.]